MPRSRRQRFAVGLGRGVIYFSAFLLILIGAALGALETGWGKNQLRRLILQQANQYLTATLEIDRLEGSLLRGLQLSGVRLSRDGHAIIGIDEVALSYSIRELVEQGTTLRRIRLTRPHVVAGREADGRWDLAALVKRQAREQERTGPGRPIHLLSVEVIDGTIELRNPFSFGAAHVPTRFDALNTSLSFDYEPVNWRLEFVEMSWRGTAPDLTIERLTGGIASASPGLSFKQLKVVTPKSEFVLDGLIARDRQPSVLDLQVDAQRFAFQEWAGIINGLKNIAVEGAFGARLKGPLAALTTDLTLRSTGGNVRGPLVLDTTVPGWHGRGTVELERLNLAKWFNRPDRPSDITGNATFDLALDLGHVPHGSYTFEGSHARYLQYEGDNVRAKGTIATKEVLIQQASATAYGANVHLSSGAIAFDEPLHFRFQGTADKVDLRLMPEELPVPHVESTLAFDFDVSGQFTQPFIKGQARFNPSEFLGAAIGTGSVGTIDTSAMPVHYTGEGDVSHLDIHHFGEGLDVAWMREPRYAGTIAGHFHVDGSGSDRQTMILSGGGRLTRADLFDGTLTDAAVDVQIENGSLRATYDGRLTAVNPALALADPRYAASLNGSGRAQFAVNDLLFRSPTLDDYKIEATLSLEEKSVIRGVRVDRGSTTATLSGSSLALTALQLAGPAIDLQGSGVLELDGQRSSRFEYSIARADLAGLKDLVGREIPGELVTKGQLTGPLDRLRLVGDGVLTHLDYSGVQVLTTTATYDATIPVDQPVRSTARLEGHASFVEAFGQTLQQVDGTVTYDKERLDLDLQLVRNEAIKGGIAGSALLHSDRRSLDLSKLSLSFRNAVWQLAPAGAPPTIRWDDRGITVSPATLVVADDPNQRIDVSGTWRDDGNGALRIVARHVFLDTLALERPARYGGAIDLDATLRGTRDRPLVSADLTIADGRVRQFSYQKLAGHIDYADEMMKVDLRVDQASGVWLIAVGTVPIAVADPSRAAKPINVAISSSAIGLGLIEGVTDVVRNVSGELHVNVTVVGTSADPHVTGAVDIANAAFAIVDSGSRYKNGRASLQFAEDRVSVAAFHLEDNRGRPLEVSGSLPTHELRVGDLEINITSKGFEVLRNEFGTMDVDARLSIRGRFELPRIEGSVTITGGELKVDEILDRTLFRPYATVAASAPAVDAVAALNPWERLGLNIQLHVPGTLRMTGDEVQVTQGTPIGLGSINIRVIGDLYLTKDPGQPLYVTGSFDSMTGTYAFQGRRFDLDPTSSINFRSDVTNPELYVTVSRVISGVETRVTIAGPLREPELRLASTPSLEATDILSLIVFNASTSDLSLAQQRDLAIRAGALAAGFLTTPLLGALERSLGLDIIEVEPPTGLRSGGPRVTVGDELAPGLVARFSRQFGLGEYDEATLEYQLSRILRLRATFSDATGLATRAGFRRVERAGIDLIVFFSF
jgi:autotransporter translocation and assembly factor TamB